MVKTTPVTQTNYASKTNPTILQDVIQATVEKFGQVKKRQSRKSVRKAARKMTFSRLMLMGAKATRPAYGTYLDRVDWSITPMFEACALGAAYYANVILSIQDEGARTRALLRFADANSSKAKGVRDLRKQFPVLAAKARCPGGCFQKHETLFDTVIHLNDDHEWTRERIAEWVAEEEKKFEGVTVYEYETVQTR